MLLFSTTIGVLIGANEFERKHVMMSWKLDNIRATLRWMLAAAYFIVGVIHLRSPSLFLPIMPDWVPDPYDVILVTGFSEIAGSIALLTKRWRSLAGVMLALYAICVYPANIKHALDNVTIGGGHLSWWYHGPRLLIQPVIVWWALFAGGVVNWPFKAKASPAP